MTFRCRQCGDCCSSMGEIIGIDEQIEPAKYRIRFLVTGEERVVSLDADKADLFCSQDIRTIRPMACPFLRFKEPDLACCTVHLTRPDLCRQYACFRVLVLDKDGNVVGKVPERTRLFSTLDARLRELWQREIEGVDIPGDTAWEAGVEDVFSRAGYRVIR